MSHNVTLKLDCGLRTVVGEGDQLTFHVWGNRKNKAGNYEHYELELKACRYAVKTILRELRRMHNRDRVRLVNETRRIELEVAELTKEGE